MTRRHDTEMKELIAQQEVDCSALGSIHTSEVSCAGEIKISVTETQL